MNIDSQGLAEIAHKPTTKRTVKSLQDCLNVTRTKSINSTTLIELIDTMARQRVSYSLV